MLSRLAEIKSNIEYNRFGSKIILTFSEYNYLIQRAERLQKLEKENKRYREALEFYADEEHYKEKLISEAQYDADGICISNDEYAPPIIYFDNGETARQALEGENDG